MRKSKAVSEMICHAFLQKSAKSALRKFLPPAEAKATFSFWKDPTLGFAPPEKQLSQIHFSWLASPLRSLPTTDIGLFLSALDGKQAEALRTHLKVADKPHKLTSLTKLFLQQKLLDKVSEGDILPVECLPPSQLNALLSLQPAHFEILAKFLGLHDLSTEMRHIIDTRKLRQIEAALQENEQSYLKILMQSDEPLVFTRMGLSSWKGSSSELAQLVRGRGFNRLAKALYLEHPSLQWHVAHLLDSDLALSIKKLSTPVEGAQTAKILTHQVLEILSFMGVAHG